MLYWAIEMDGQWFSMKHNCWYPQLQRECIFDSKEGAIFFHERWLTEEQRAKAKLVPFQLVRVPEET